MIKFFENVWNELKKVIWPTRAETVKYTLTVIFFSLAVAFVLGAADAGLLKIFEQILSR